MPPKEFEIPPQEFISPIGTGNYSFQSNEIKAQECSSIGEVGWVDERESLEQEISNLKLELTRISQERDKLQRSQDNAGPPPHVMYGALREEIQNLKKKLVSLETAEGENEALRKDFKKLRIASQEEKSMMEADFMNQLTAVGREHALRLEELEGSLQASNCTNRALTEQNQEAAAELEAKIQEIQRENEQEIERLTESRNYDIAKLEVSLQQIEEELKDATAAIELGTIESQAKEKEIMLQRGKILQSKAALKTKEAELDEANEKLNSAEGVCDVLRSKIDESETTISTLENQISQLQKELDESISAVALGQANIEAKDDELSQLREQMEKIAGTSENEILSLKKQISKLQEQLDESTSAVALGQSKIEAKEEELSQLREQMDSLAQVSKSEVMQLENRVVQLTEELTNAKSAVDLAEQEARSGKNKVSTLTDIISQLQKEQNAAPKAAIVHQMKSKLEVLGSRVVELEDEKRSRMMSMKGEVEMFREMIEDEKKKTLKLQNRVELSYVHEALLEEAELREEKILEEKKRLRKALKKIEAEKQKTVQENKRLQKMMRKMLDKLG